MMVVLLNLSHQNVPTTRPTLNYRQDDSTYAHGQLHFKELRKTYEEQEALCPSQGRANVGCRALLFQLNLMGV